MAEGHFFTAADGVRLHFADTGPQGAAIPLLCLAGLTRHSGDFAPVFDQLAGMRRVIALDFRGRGLSGHAADSSTYNPVQEMADTIALLDHLGLSRVAVLGTSRGGIVGMLMASLHPARVAGLMLNDVGPVIDAAGLIRIRKYVGERNSFATWDAAARAFARVSSGFELVPHEKWMAAARRVYGEVAGRPTTLHDPRLADTFPTLEQIESGDVKELWPVYDTLATPHLAVLRGANSDLLSAATAQEMRLRKPHLQWTDVDHRGHVPFLDESESKQAIERWLAAIE